LKSIVRKFHTLISNPVGVYRKYKGKLKATLLKLSGASSPIYGEDYDAHWNFTSFRNKIVLDLGADYGSTAYYFLRKGATKVIAVEGDQQLAEKLRRNFQNDERVICIHGFINETKQISDLILHHHPNLIKVDIEGNEKLILNLSNEDLKRVEWLIEAHSDEIYESLKRFFLNNQFKVRSFQYIDNLKILHAFPQNPKNGM
jgi:precorrin-6B methylase 2